MPHLAACLLLLSAAGAGAVDLYRASAAVDDATPAARAPALRAALGEVLLRLTASRTQAEAALARLGPRAEHYVVAYQYLDAPDGTRLLEARFDPDALHAALREGGHPVWGEPRPRLLVWLAYDGGSGPTLIGADDPLAAVAREAGGRFGLPLEFPLLMPDERSAVPPRAVVQLDWARLNDAGAAYGADAVVALLISASAGGLKGRVNLALPDGATSSATLSAPDLDGLLAAASQRLAGDLAVYFLAQAPPVPVGVPQGGVIAAPAGGLVVEIAPIGSPAAYAAVRVQLDALEGVEALMPLWANEDTVAFALDYAGGALALRRALALEGAFEPLPDSDPQVLRLRYAGR